MFSNTICRILAKKPVFGVYVPSLDGKTVNPNAEEQFDKHFLENFKKHIAKAKVNCAYYLVKEQSPNELLHIHGLFIYRTYEDQLKMEDYIDNHRLKAYIDKYKPITDNYKFLCYIRKNLREKSKKYIDFDYLNKDYFNFDNLLKMGQFYEMTSLEKDQDIFLD